MLPMMGLIGGGSASVREQHLLAGPQSIQQLGRTGIDFDCLLKGQFYQALLIKRQRKLGCLKSFHNILAHARMLEEHEKQFAASAHPNETRKGSSDGSRKTPHRNIPDKETIPLQVRHCLREHLVEKLFPFTNAGVTSANS